MNTNQKQLYEAQAGSPAEMPMDRRQTAICDMLRRHCHLNRSGVVTVAELSVGNGALSHGLLGIDEQLRLTCVDISTVLLEHLKETLRRRDPRWLNRVTLVEGNLDNDFGQLRDASYEAVIAVDVLEHVFDTFGFIAHCHRILKVGGILLLRVPNIVYVKHRFGLLFGRLPVTSSWYGPSRSMSAWRSRYGWDGGHLHYFNLWGLTQLLNEAGFELREVSDPGSSFARVRSAWPEMLCGNLAIAAVRSV